MIGRFGSAVVLCVVLPAAAAGQSEDTSAMCAMDTVTDRHHPRAGRPLH